MNTILAFCICVAIALPVSIHGLQCYSCDLCSVPFTTNNATIVSVNVTGASCTKYVFASYVSKGYATDCAQVNVNGIGTWCCSTDLCNAGQSIGSFDSKRILATFLVAIGIMKMIHS
ncbi:unnamed protein product [Adineta ricciae]|uniref:Uncharacterized protein n=1 Tax=Adineta ricciae TaxID=249248 RepID=A0A813ZMK1_ADIRI|nr:unnamed protein product [Adineta ricciae]CAF1423131.1 unnamed protein product [Adineta ricciae]